MTASAIEALPAAAPDLASAYLSECRSLVLAEIERIVPKQTRFRRVLYDLMLEYPMRDAKALRPSLCIATCRAFGGSLEGVLQSATVLELYHNAFLIHDDVEDASLQRRGEPTLHGRYGIPIAVNVGDGMLALALEPLFDNMRLLGLGKALRILKLVGEMARHTAEGQALELSWIREGTWQVPDSAYLRMVHKKTTWYSFLTPVTLGAIVAGAQPPQLRGLQLFATALGAAFQIQDDVLNLVASPEDYGKDALGDLWEGKHTLVLLHALRTATPHERARAHSILRLPNSCLPGGGELETRVRALERRGELSSDGCRELLGVLRTGAQGSKCEADIAYLMTLIERHGSLSYARSVAARHAQRARRSLEAIPGLNRGTSHYRFLESLMQFVVTRDH